MPNPRPRPGPGNSGRPTPREVIDRARSAAGPKVAKAIESATPHVEKAAGSAGKLFGTLRERAKDAAREFNEGYRGDHDVDRPRPRPRSD